MPTSFRRSSGRSPSQFVPPTSRRSPGGRNLAARFQQAATPAAAPSASQSLRDAAALLRTFADVLSDPKTDPAAAAAALSTWQDKFVDELKMLLSQFNPPPLKVGNIPPELRSHLVSQNGDYALYVDPKKDLWNRQNLDEFEKQVEAKAASVPGARRSPASPPTSLTPRVDRAGVLFRDRLRARPHLRAGADRLARHPPDADRRERSGARLADAGGVDGRLHASWNFANFFGLPILIGAGHEYGVFMMHRYREVLHDPRRVWRRWDPADRTCSCAALRHLQQLGFFWLLAHHKGLESLGLVMALGTACISLATILVVRPLLTLHLQRCGRNSRRMRQPTPN